MSKKIGVGIIGASADRGWARVAHLPALQSLGAYEIRAVSTTRRETAERSARELGIDLFFDNHRDLLARPEVDLAVVAVNVTFHRQVATAAIEAAKMVFCEWPLGRNLLEAQEIASLARKGCQNVDRSPGSTFACRPIYPRSPRRWLCRKASQHKRPGLRSG